jgi:hypothetical protein
MAKEKKTYEEVSEYNKIATQLVEKFPEKFGSVMVNQLVCYGITNKDRPDRKRELYDISAGKEPEAFTNSKKIFIEFYMSDWNERTPEQKLWLVYEGLRRIDTTVEPPKVMPLDYRDSAELVRTLGPDWAEKETLPNPLSDKVNFRE